MCSPKTMLKIGAVIAIPLVGGYFLFPQFRLAIAGLLPFAFFAICPLSMLFGMKLMGKEGNACQHDHAKNEARQKTLVTPKNP